MKWSRIAFAAAFLCAFAAAAVTEQTPAYSKIERRLEVAPPAALAVQLDPKDALRALNIPSASVALIDGGKVLWAHAWGDASPQTLYQAASLSKLVTAVAALSSGNCPFVNWALFTGCTALVLGFRSTEALAALYGLAVSGVMFATSAAMIPVGVRYWGWSPLASGGLFGFLTLINAVFCIASSLKLLDGGYIPLGVGLVIFTVMLTWRWGRRATAAAYRTKHTMSMRKLVELHRSEPAYMERIGLLVTPKHLTSLNDKSPALLQLMV